MAGPVLYWFGHNHTARFAGHSAMSTTSLQGKRILVTQASDFMGPMLCTVLAEHGATVIASHESLVPLESAAQAVAGAVLQMFSHGVIAGLLFAVVGRMVYERTHTRELATLEGMNLVKAMPFAAVTFVIAGAASMGLPGFSGFIAELQVIIGAWQAFPTLAVITGVGIVIGVAYTLRAMQKAFFGETGSGADRTDETHATDDEHHAREPISVPERIGAVLLIAVSLVVGLYPRLLLDVIIPSFNSPLFDWVKKGGAQ